MIYEEKIKKTRLLSSSFSFLVYFLYKEETSTKKKKESKEKHNAFTALIRLSRNNSSSIRHVVQFIDHIIGY